MKSYFIEEFYNYNNYANFIDYMVRHSMYFSLVYFKYAPNEKMGKSCRQIHDALLPYKYKSFSTNMWPGTFTLNQSKSVYKVVLYHATVEAVSILSSVKDLYNWNYPAYPIDLCFYKDGYCWMDSTSHEQSAHLYTDAPEDLATLQALNAHLSFDKEMSETKLFKLEDLKSKFSEKPYWQ